MKWKELLESTTKRTIVCSLNWSLNFDVKSLLSVGGEKLEICKARMVSKKTPTILICARYGFNKQ